MFTMSSKKDLKKSSSVSLSVSVNEPYAFVYIVGKATSTATSLPDGFIQTQFHVQIEQRHKTEKFAFVK